MKTSKKILSTLLATTMALGMAVPAFAAGSGSSGSSSNSGSNETVTVTSELNAPTIEVETSGSGSIVLNPYGMKFSDEDLGIEDSTDTVIHETGYIASTTLCGLSVTATVTGTAGGEATLSSKALTEKDTGKAVFLYAQFKNADDNTSDLEWDDEYNTAKDSTDILVGTKATSKVVGTIDASDGTDAKYLAFHLGGEANGNATKAWDENDKVTVAFVFSFVPTSNGSSSND